ncbi:MAG TPA: polysaccharide pyruvyl transferase CsaB [Syntrophomonadaceae bacterium]|nr:polysaccharide pyruvyl transferase CsaB [Syntrophomonadaceae bacterium]
MKIALSGYYGFDNAGDEALLSAITSSIKPLAPEAEFVVFSGNPAKTSSAHGIRAIYYKNPWVLIRELWECDLLISGGGSIFQDITSARSLPYYISVVALAKMLGKPVMFYAQGVGPIRRPFSKFLMRLVASRVDMISLRDQESASVLRELGVTRPPLRITADPVFSLQPGVEEKGVIERLSQDQGWNKLPLICVSVRHWPALDGYQTNLARVLDTMVLRGYGVLFAPMAWPEDIPESKEVLALMKEKAFLIDKRLSSTELLALIGRSKLVIGMRLHALIFAASQGVLFAGISYDPKVDAFLHLYQLDSLPPTAENMSTCLDRLLDQAEVQKRIAEKSEELRARAQENAGLALSLIKRRKS